MAFAYDESHAVFDDMAPWAGEFPEETTMKRLIHVRSFALWAATNDEKPLMHVSPRPQPIEPPSTPRRRQSVTSLSPSPKSKSPKKKVKQSFFVMAYEPEHLSGEQLVRDIMETINADHEASLNAHPSSINDIFEKLKSFGLGSEVIRDCKACVPTLLRDYDPEFVLSALLGDPLRRIVRLIVEDRVMEYDESRRHTTQSPSSFYPLKIHPHTRTQSDHSLLTPSSTMSRKDSSRAHSISALKSNTTQTASRSSTKNKNDQDEPSRPQKP
jgi:hypothetical protein